MQFSSLGEAFEIWIRAVEAAIVAVLDRLRRPRQIRVIEDKDNTFRIVTLGAKQEPGESEALVTIVDGAVSNLDPAVAAALKGSQTELILRSSRFLFRPLEVPQRAAEFLEGIVRGQIDRLTPWNANDAVFGWTTTAVPSRERISLVVCATARAVIAPYVHALVGLGIESVIVSTFPEGEVAQVAPVSVLEDKSKTKLAHARIRRGLIGLLLLAALVTAAATIADEFIGGELDAQKIALAQDIAKYRADLRRNSGDGASEAQQLLEQHKRETPSAVIVLEALSRILPDHTYIKELRIEGDKLQIVGITHDAPELIRLIEQSPNFTRATFFAPTTSTAGSPGEDFHIEAHIKAAFEVGT